MTIGKSFRFVALFGGPLLAVLIAGCATVTPAELTNARTAYARASAGPASQYTPADLHKARVALDKAEQSFSEEKDSQKTIDLAYIAERTAQTAEALAAGAIASKKVADAKEAYGAEQGAIVKNTQGALVKSREQLAENEQARLQQEQQLTTERSARQDADKKADASEQRAQAADQKTKEANDALAKLAAKDEERGMVITLSGSVLFRTNDSTLLPAAQARLDQVADAVVAKGHPVVVEGYTDSRGSQATNLALSQRRAESVRSYLVSRGVPQATISARGMGADRPVAENTNAEGRANNRRVEIVIAKNDVAK